METGNWKEIDFKILKKIDEIFQYYDIKKLSDFEKRKIIFEYLCNNISYDFDLLDNIKNRGISKIKVSRNPYYEFSSVMDDGIGICNAISQYYKLLLERVGISAYCIITSDGTEVLHQLNLVIDQQNCCFGFDDVTSVIVGRGSVDEFFDYDLEQANKLNQGLLTIMDGDKWFILPESYINYLVGRKSSPTITIDKLPINIKSSIVKNTIKQ